MGDDCEISKSIIRYNHILIKTHTDSMNNARTAFNNTCIEFIDAIMSVLPSETNLLLIKIYIKTKISQDKLVRRFIKYVLPVKNFITRRDEKFFMDNQYIDNLFANKTVPFDFRAIWKKLNNENRESVWDWFNTLISIAEDYKNSDCKIEECNQRSGTIKQTH
jgi:hypothetical protein